MYDLGGCKIPAYPAYADSICYINPKAMSIPATFSSVSQSLVLWQYTYICGVFFFCAVIVL